MVGWLHQQRFSCKIQELRSAIRANAHDDLSLEVTCVLEVFGEIDPTQPALAARRLVGATLLVEHMRKVEAYLKGLSSGR